LIHQKSKTNYLFFGYVLLSFGDVLGIFVPSATIVSTKSLTCTAIPASMSSTASWSSSKLLTPDVDAADAEAKSKAYMI
jgi:hypothetical protein